MKKKLLVIIVAVLVVIGATIGVIAGVTANKGGSGSSAGGPSGGETPDDPKVTYTAEDFTISANVSVELLKFCNMNGRQKTVDKTKYHAETMRSIVDEGYFTGRLCVNVAVTNPKGERKSLPIYLKFDTNHTGSPYDAEIYAIVDNDIKFRLSNLTCERSDIFGIMTGLGCDDDSAERFTGFRKEDGKFPGVEPRQGFDVTQYIDGYKNGSVTITPPQIIVVDEIEDAPDEVVFTGDDISRLEAHLDFKPYGTARYDDLTKIITYSKESGALNSIIPSNTFLADYQYDYSVGYGDLFGDYDADEQGVYIDKNEVSFSKVIGFTRVRFKYEFGDYFANKYSRYAPTVSKVKEKYDFEGTHKEALTTFVSFLGQDKTLTVKKETVEGRYEYYYIDKTDLPVFFAEKMPATKVEKYKIGNTEYDSIPWEREYPNSVAVTMEDSYAGEFSCMNMVLSFTYDDYVTSTKIKDIGEDYEDVDDAFYNITNNTGARLISTNFYGYVFDENIGKAKTEPFVYNYCTFPLGGRNYSFNLSFKVMPKYERLDLVSRGPNEGLKTSYYEGERLSYEEDLQICLYYYNAVYKNKLHGNEEYIYEYVPFEEEYIVGFSTEKSSDGKDIKYRLSYNGTETELYATYKVLPNPVVSITLSEGAFEGLYVKDENFNLKGESITVTREFGENRVSTIPVTEDMLSGIDTSKGGTQTVTVTYKGQTVSKELTIKTVTKIEFYERISTIYVTGELPSEVLIKVVFDGDAEDYEIYDLTREQIASAMDTSVAGPHEFSYTFGGVTLRIDYKVIEGIYVTYTITTDDTAKIDGITDNKPTDDYYFKAQSLSTMEIPSVVNYDGVDYPVTEISVEVFYGRGGVTTVILPDSLNKIPDYAFADCPDLQKLVFKGNVDEIGLAILQKSNAVKEVVIPAEAKEKLYLFFVKQPKSDKKAVIPNNLIVRFTEGSVSLPSLYFTGLNKDIFIETVEFPMSLETLNEQGNGFDIVKEFKSKEGGQITVKSNVIYTDAGKTLYYYPKLATAETLVIDDEVTKIGSISGNEYLKTVTVGANVKELATGAFLDFTALTKVTFKGPLKIIPEDAFNGCTSLTTFGFPEGLETIGKTAFYICGLKTLDIPKSVTKIGERAFGSSKNLEKIRFESNLDDCFDTTKGAVNLGLRKLQVIEYSGNIPLKNLSCYSRYDAMSGTVGVSKIIVTKKVCDNFAQGSTMYGDRVSWPSQGVYCRAGVKYIGNNATDSFFKEKLYFEDSSTDGVTFNTPQNSFEIQKGVTPSF